MNDTADDKAGAAFAKMTNRLKLWIVGANSGGGDRESPMALRFEET
jgi:hypothetical protein